MSKRPGSRSSLATLILWLCLGSLVVFAVIGGVGPPSLGLSEIDLESYDPFDRIEADDDFLILSIAGVIIAGLISSKLQTIDLDFQSAFLVPDFPPPKPS